MDMVGKQTTQKRGIEMKKKRHLTVIAISAMSMLFLNVTPLHAEELSIEQHKAYFNATYYYLKYPDVAAAFGNNETALLNHYLTYGINEKRRGWPGEGETAQAPIVVVANGSTKSAGASSPTAPANPVYASNQYYTPGTVLATYSTNYTAGIPRETNLQVASSRINGTVLQPGAEFSYSNTILPRTSENGYVAAPVIIGGKYVQGMGGGICQVSSTLYAAMKTAGIPATERHPHSLKPSYIPVGYDATISQGTKDLRFSNPYQQPMRIDSNCADGVITVTLTLN